ncbi:hypothetical protein [Primorskyibacter sp. S87]|uniref:hypothetical protein n=1 Tax=Primorskyibacter sp. S87 TaxID=3415126 RepID=UPI003C7E36EE
MRQAVWASFLMSAGLLATTAAAEGEPEQWGESGSWKILVDQSNGNGCFAQKDLESGARVEIGFAPVRGGGFFAVMHPDWTDIEDGQKAVIEFDFKDARFAGEVVGAIRQGLPGGYAYFDNPAFADEFGKRNVVTVKGEQEDRVVDVNLKGSMKAIGAVKECQKQQPDPKPAESN